MVAVAGPSGAQAPAPAVAAAMDHLAIYVRDPDVSASFYVRAFGFRQVPAPVPFARWLLMANGVALHIVGGRPTPVDHAKFDHLALAGGDMDALIAHLARENIPWTDIQGRPQPQVRPDGVKQIFVRDPDGYWIEINDSLARR